MLNEKIIVEEEIKNIQTEYGYIFFKADGITEALIKINCNSKIFYFAVQNGELMLLNIEQNQYEKTIKYMLDHHECLKNKGSIK